jgi:hypothetical protein
VPCPGQPVGTGQAAEAGTDHNDIVTVAGFVKGSKSHNPVLPEISKEPGFQEDAAFLETPVSSLFTILLNQITPRMNTDGHGYQKRGREIFCR